MGGGGFLCHMSKLKMAVSTVTQFAMYDVRFMQPKYAMSNLKISFVMSLAMLLGFMCHFDCKQYQRGVSNLL